MSAATHTATKPPRFDLQDWIIVLALIAAGVVLTLLGSCSTRPITVPETPDGPVVARVRVGDPCDVVFHHAEGTTRMPAVLGDGKPWITEVEIWTPMDSIFKVELWYHGRLLKSVTFVEPGAAKPGQVFQWPNGGERVPD